MLILFDLPKDKIHAFNSYHTLFNHIHSLERTKEKRKWFFARHSCERVISFYQYIREQKSFVEPESFEESLKQALKQTNKKTIEREGSEKGDILEIVNGNVKKPNFIPITLGVDVEDLQKQWCRNYCKNHGYVLFEVSKPTDFKQYPGGKNDYAAG